MQTEKLIHEYEMELREPPCFPGAAEWSARADVKTDISEVFPYLNAEFEDAEYDHTTGVLIWKGKEHSYAFRPHEIKVAPVCDREEARELIEECIERVNATWRRRHEIMPVFKKRALPDLMNIYMLLPRTNCGECGYSTCMAFAADLRKGKVGLTQCPLLETAEFAENRTRLQELFSASEQ